MDGFRVVPQRLFANWEMDRTSSSTIQRVFSLSVCRLSLFHYPAQLRSFVITAKLEGNKRTLRSNEVVPSPGQDSLDLPLDISFTIQYPHFLKHKRNVVQIHVQRKRKYKNRPIPGGFKTVAVGAVDLSAILQCGGVGQRGEIPLYAIESRSGKLPSGDLQSIGRLVLSNCGSQPLDVESEGRVQGGQREKEKEEDDDSEDSEDDEVADRDDAAMSARSNGAARTGRDLRDSQRRRKRAQRKNIKQRLANLLKRFRLPDEESGAISAAASSTAREPTATELQALFDELDELSDSANEGIAADEASIVSNPRPALRPFFSREQLMPAIYDERGSDSEGEELEWSSETECLPGASLPLTHPPLGPSTSGGSGGGGQQSGRSYSSTGAGPHSGFNYISHSQTAGSIASAREKGVPPLVARNSSISDQMYSLLCSEPVGNDSGSALSPHASSSRHQECIWLCSVPDDIICELSIAAQGSAHLSAANLVSTPCLRDVRTAIQQIVAKIQSFCNSNSSPPPMTYIGVLGNDRLVSHVLRAYVDALQHKSASSWLGYLRFSLLVPPTSLTGRLIAGLDSQLEQLSYDIWERWGDLSVTERKGAVEKMGGWPRRGGTTVSVNLPIGEALLQLTEKGPEQTDSRLFVPFLTEVRVGSGEEEEGAPCNSPRIAEEAVTHPSHPSQSSPPASPHVKGGSHPGGMESLEMQVEYWLGSERAENVLQVVQLGQPPTTPQSKKDTAKGSMKTHFFTLAVSRTTASQLLALTFVKEKKKDKMLQKLGMKNKQRGETEASPVQISSISRLLCSGISKHSSLTVWVDGTAYSDVRFFQTSSQWQTHVRHFPVALLSTGPNIL